jgi:hypothetical protein
MTLSIKGLASLTMLFSLLALVGCGSAGPVPPLPGVGVAPAAPVAQGQALRVFYSGHSLMDRPVPDQVEALAQADSVALAWNRQYRVGSLLRERTRGLDPASSEWTGWTVGENREGQGLDVLAALSGRDSAEMPFDVLVATERHDIVWAMTHEASAAYLRRLHDARVLGRPQGATWLYESWQSFDPSQVVAWAGYERAVGGAWQCVAAEVNRSLQQEGRSDRVWSLPAARALVILVEAALSPAGVPGISTGETATTLARVFSDNVHLTELGKHYMALVTWAFVSGRPAAMPWRPESVTPEQSDSLRAVAARAHEALRGQTLAQASEADCTAHLQAVCPAYWAYIEDRQRAGGRPAWSAWLDRAKQEWRCDRAIADGRHQVSALGR